MEITAVPCETFIVNFKANVDLKPLEELRKVSM